MGILGPTQKCNSLLAVMLLVNSVYSQDAVSIAILHSMGAFDTIVTPIGMGATIFDASYSRQVHNRIIDMRAHEIGREVVANFYFALRQWRWE